MFLRSVIKSAPIIAKFARSFAEKTPPYIRTFKITTRTTTKGKDDVNMKGQGQAETHIKSPLEVLLGALCTCKTHTAFYTAKNHLKINIDNMNFVKAEGVIDVRGFAGDPSVRSKFSEINLEVIVETNGTQAQVEELGKLVARRCPVACILEDSGAKISATWRKA
jgi:uncharacterized OsmC-like protein